MTLKQLHETAKQNAKTKPKEDYWKGHAAAWTEVDKTLTYLTSPRRIKQKYGRTQT